MRHFLLPYRNSLVSVYQYGNGARKVLCFHGYGEEATGFSFLEKHAGEAFSFYAIDLPFHGKTNWKEDLEFTSNDLLKIIDIIPGLPANDKMILMGFSLGGRMVLSLYQSNPSRFDRIILMAPDGLKVNFWYWLATQTWLGNKLFRFTMKYPAWFFVLLKTFNRLRLVNASVFKFVKYYIDNKDVRWLLYARWTSLRKIKPDLPSIKSQVRRYSTAVRLLYGKHDRIILSSVGEKFQRGIESHCCIRIIHSGHQVLHEHHVEEILPSLSQ